MRYVACSSISVNFAPEHVVLIHLLQKLGRSDILDDFKFVVPSFHAYGHDAACQVGLIQFAGYVHAPNLTIRWQNLHKYASTEC